MWIYTPDVAHNTDLMETIYTQGGGDTRLHFKYNGRDDGLVFLHPLSAVRAFDAVMKGLSEGCKSVFLQEFRLSVIDPPVLKVTYDRTDYETPVKEVYNGWVQIDDLTATRNGFITIVKKEA